jgi:cell division protein FtsL
MKLTQILLWPFKSYLRIIIVVAVVGLYQYQSIQIDILAREIRNLELKRNQLRNQTASLQVSIDQLTHINRIEKIAKEQFGLIAPGREMPKIIIEKFDDDDTIEPDLELAGMH